MISTTGKTYNIEDIDSRWIFEHYSSSSTPLNGQTIIIKSPVNSTQKSPSLYIFLGFDGTYKFKDHSTGRGGGSISFVAYLYNITNREAEIQILSDYNKLSTVPIKYEPIVYNEPYTIANITYGRWDKNDKEYWQQYGITLNTLKHFNVKKIIYVKITNTKNTLEFGGHNVYAFCNKYGEPYKIYKPNSKMKFFFINHYLQGLDQLTYKTDSIIILSSLKEIMVFHELYGNEYDKIAPSGESELISPTYIHHFDKIYKNKYVLLDNDKTGKEMNQKYSDLYGYQPIMLDLSKDISDSIKDYNKKFVKQKIDLLWKTKE